MPTYGRPSSTVGRISEVGYLRGTLDDSMNRRGAAVMIEGEPGMGKSHLLRQLAHDARALGMSVVYLTGHVSDSFEPYAGLSQLPRLSDFATDTPPPASQDARTRFVGFNDYLSTLSRSPTLFVVDDLQWVDEPSLQIISRSIENMINQGIAFVCAVRTGAMPNALPASQVLRSIQRSCTSLHLEGLNEADTATLATTIGEVHVDPDHLREINRTARGNPLFTLEYLRLLLGSKSPNLQTAPPAVSRVIEERIRSTSIDVRVLVVLALLGGVGSIDDVVLIAESFGLPPKRTREDLVVAEAAVLINRSAGRTIDFVHPLFAQCAAEFAESHDQSLRMAVIAFLEKSGRFAEAFALCDPTMLHPRSEIARRLAMASIDEAWTSDSTLATCTPAEYLVGLDHQQSIEWVHAALILARYQLNHGEREQGWSLAERASASARHLGLHLELAHALLVMARFAEFVPDTRGFTDCLTALDLEQIPVELRARVLAASAQVVLSTPTAVADGIRPFGEALRTAGIEISESSTRAAWAWSTNAQGARALANQALKLLTQPDISDATKVRTLNSWREVHRAPAFLSQRLRQSEQTLRLSDPSAAIEGRLLRSIDLYESGSTQLSTSELIVAGEAAKRYGDAWGQWRIALRWASRALALGNIEEAWELSAAAVEYGEKAGEPGRIPALAAQQCATAVERGFPQDQLWVFSIDPALTAHGPSRALAALACASAGDNEQASRLLKDSYDIFDDEDRESSFVLTLTTLVEVAAIVGDTDFAAQALPVLAPLSGRNVIDGLGTLMRGPVDRYTGLARRTIGDSDGAVDDLLRSKQLAQDNGEELWRLASLIDIAETLSASDTARLARLVRMADIDAAFQSNLTWRANRGRVALVDSGRLLKENLTLSDRQVTILQEMSHGLTIAEIGRKLRFSHSTVRQESMAIYRLLEVDGRDAAISVAKERFLI